MNFYNMDVQIFALCQDIDEALLLRGSRNKAKWSLIHSRFPLWPLTELSRRIGGFVLQLKNSRLRTALRQSTLATEVNSCLRCQRAWMEK